MDFRNSNEALREMSIQKKEQIWCVKLLPSRHHKLKRNFKIPVFAYQASGEYSYYQKG